MLLIVHLTAAASLEKTTVLFQTHKLFTRSNCTQETNNLCLCLALVSMVSIRRTFNVLSHRICPPTCLKKRKTGTVQLPYCFERIAQQFNFNLIVLHV